MPVAHSFAVIRHVEPVGVLVAKGPPLRVRGSAELCGTGLPNCRQYTTTCLSKLFACGTRTVVVDKASTESALPRGAHVPRLRSGDRHENRKRLLAPRCDRSRGGDDRTRRIHRRARPWCPEPR